MEQSLSGRCLCKAIRYRCGPVAVPADAVSLRVVPAGGRCACRRLADRAAHRSALERGGSAQEFESSPGVHRAFCGQCGTPLTYRSAARPTEIDVTICSLEQPELAAPVDHIWMQDAPPWDRPGDGLPQHPQAASRPELVARQAPRNGISQALLLLL